METAPQQAVADGNHSRLQKFGLSESDRPEVYIHDDRLSSITRANLAELSSSDDTWEGGTIHESAWWAEPRFFDTKDRIETWLQRIDKPWTPESTTYEPIYWDGWIPLLDKYHTPGRDFAFELQCNLKDCLENNPSAELGSILVLTGEPDKAYATVCQEYVQKQWPKVGIPVLEAVSHTLRIGAFSSEYFTLNLVNNDNNADSIQFMEVQIYVPYFDHAVAIAQTLTWLAISLQPPVTDDKLYCSSAVVRRSSHLMISLGDLEEVSSRNGDSCWHPLFQGSVIARHFPVRSGEKGLELPFPVMLDMANVLYHTDLAKYHQTPQQCNGIFYSGVNSVLYPMDRGQGGNVIRWHYAAADEVMVPPTDRDWLRTCAQDELENSTTILGYTSLARVHLGTADRMNQYEQMQYSSADRERDGAFFTWDGITLQAGYSGASIASTFKYRRLKGRRAIADARSLVYDEILEKATKTPVILFDTLPGHEMGWLVSQLSVILDLVHCKIRKENYWNSAEHNSLHAALQPDGGLAARLILGNYRNASKELYKSAADDTSFSIKDLVIQMYVAMSVRKQQDHQEQSPLQSSTPLVGWDLIELLSPPEVSYRLQKKIHQTSTSLKHNPPSWFALTQEMSVFFCENAGEIISSAPPLSSNLQRGKKYLTASMHALRNKRKTRPDCTDYHIDLQRPLIWEPPRLSSVRSERRCRSEEEVFFSRIQLFIPEKHHQCSVRPGHCHLEPDGAVVFGAPRSKVETLSDMIEDLDFAVQFRASSQPRTPSVVPAQAQSLRISSGTRGY